MQEPASDRTPPTLSGARLTRHADYQRVYQQSRKHFSASMTYFFTPRAEDLPVVNGPRVGLTAGRVLGKAVERNRIKRRMREAVRHNLGCLQSNVDVVLHPRKSVLEMDFSRLEGEVGRVFVTVEASLKKDGQKADV
ncbi:ribonuclease P protein component [Alloacidobacterium sp.]|uniref:ribonuclease P protein component n=1 Tax=Alloacidobacterium sp. TaxID=2951999 RepID=UPI002D5C4531|nr:ribonuclease P protein component [Alloacidobacterium sp.]HYK37942.1 ribonuclease P protein component [Alloacidobacterium sp.]